MTKRLAITISGAVALGCYEAGVLFEVLDAIRQHNQHPQTIANHEQIEIDVITGASAGGMTATITAQKLLLEAGALQGPYTNSLYLPWVHDISMDALLKSHGNDRAYTSLLSSQTVVDISHRYLTGRWTGTPSPAVRHPAAAAKLALGLAISNLNGVNYSIPLHPKGQLVYTQHQDRLTRTLDSGDASCDQLATWEPLRAAAVASGAFPFAFGAVDLIREAMDFQGAQLPAGFTRGTFAYTDGGVFQNEPLGMAKSLVDGIDRHLHSDSRFYLYVSPFSGEGSSVSSDVFSADKATYVGMIGRLTASIFEQARFQDWVQTERINQQVAVFDRRAAQLKDALLNETVLDTALRPVVDMMLDMLFPGHPEQVTEGRQRLFVQFSAECEELTNKRNQSMAGVYVDTLLVLEAAAQLASKDEMTIYAVTSNPDELAGMEMQAFSGFFEQRIRDHDYDVGRTNAQKFLRDPSLLEPGRLGPIRFQPQPIRPIDTSLNGLKLAQMPRQVRENVRDRLRERAFTILEQIGVRDFALAPLFRHSLDQWIITPNLNKMLGL